MFLKGAIWKLYGVVMPGLNRHPGAVCIEGFTETDPVCYTAARNLLKIVLSGIEQCAFVSAIGSQEFSVAGNQLALVGGDCAAGINSLPSPEEPDATERFAEAERVLASSKRHLGDELHDQFSITLADMKPEYVD